MLFSGFLEYAWIFQLISASVIVAGIQLLVRFVLSDYKYCLEDLDDGSSDLIIYKAQGSKKIKVCHMSLSNAQKIIRQGDRASDVSKRYNYVQNIGCQSYSILFLDGDLWIEVIIEADSPFISEIERRIGTGDGNISFAM